jgi:hypothetical protein
MSLADRDYMRKGPDWMQRIKRANRRRMALRLGLIPLIVILVYFAWRQDIRTAVTAYARGLPSSFYWGSLVVVLLLIAPCYKSWRLQWRNRLAQRKYEKDQRLRWAAHRRK